MIQGNLPLYQNRGPDPSDANVNDLNLGLRLAQTWGQALGPDPDLPVYFFSVGGAANGNVPNRFLLWFCICSCICTNKLFDWSI